ncbi:MAG TPA: serine acetyltransferase, partial [Bacteroidia bacterium]
MKEKIILIGDGGHARVVADILEEIGSFEIIG